MNENFRAEHLIDDSIGLEVHFAKVGYSESIKLRRKMSSQRKLGETENQMLQLVEDVERAVRGIVPDDIFVEIDEILLGVLDDSNSVTLHSLRARMRFLTSAKAFLTGLERPS